MDSDSEPEQAVQATQAPMEAEQDPNPIPDDTDNEDEAKAEETKEMEVEKEEQKKEEPGKLKKLGKGKPVDKSKPSIKIAHEAKRHRHRVPHGAELYKRALRTGTIKRLLVKACVLGHGAELVDVTRSFLVAMVTEVTQKATMLVVANKKKTLTRAALNHVLPITLGTRLY